MAMLTDTQLANFKAQVDAYALYDQFRRIAAKVLRGSPEYAEAKAEGHARAWLKQESESAAIMLGDSLAQRLDSLDPYCGG